MGDRTISDAYAEWIASLEFESIPQSVVIDVRHRVLDNLGIQIAALSLPSTQAVIEAIGAWGGTPESSVPGLDVMVPAPSAALAAGLMGHSFDYDDTHFPTMMHTHAVIISAALAAGQAESRPGRDLVVAIVAGIETALRVALADPVGFQVSGLQPSSFVGIFGAAAAASRAKGLNAQRTRNALGIAGNQAFYHRRIGQGGNITHIICISFSDFTQDTAHYFSGTCFRQRRSKLKLIRFSVRPDFRCDCLSNAVLDLI